MAATAGQAMGIRGLLLFLLVLLFSGLVSTVILADDRDTTLVVVPQKATIAPPMSPVLVQRQKDRVRRAEVWRLLEESGIEPGMTIVDIGAGTGQYSYIFAEYLNNTGTVFATDVSEEMIDYMKKQAMKRGLTNMFPILVDSEGVDEFYFKNQFDVIFLAHMGSSMANKGAYFWVLRESLTDSGKLLYLQNRRIVHFRMSDVSDADGLVERLASQPAREHDRRIAGDGVIGLAKKAKEDGGAMLVKNRFVAALNEVKNDPCLLGSYLDENRQLEVTLDLNAEENEFVDWAMRLFVSDDVLNDKGCIDLVRWNIRPIHPFIMRVVNTVLMAQEYRPHLFKGRGGPYMPRNHRQGYPYHIALELSAAGYNLEQVYDFIPFEIVFEFAGQ